MNVSSIRHRLKRLEAQAAEAEPLVVVISVTDGDRPGPRMAVISGGKAQGGDVVRRLEHESADQFEARAYERCRVMFGSVLEIEENEPGEGPNL